MALNQKISFFVCFFIALFVFIVVSFSLCAPLRKWEYSLYLSEFLLPLSIIIIGIPQYFLMHYKQANSAQDDASPPYGLGIKIIIILPYVMSVGFFIFLIVGATFFLNIKLDKSPATLTHSMIIEKYAIYIYSSPHHVSYYPNHYDVIIPSATASPLPFSFSDFEAIHITNHDAKNVIPGQTYITLQLHKGFFNMPWYEHSYALSTN